MLSAVGWADDIWLRIIDLHLSKRAAYSQSKPYLEGEEYNANSRELRSLLLSASIAARIAIVYGEGRETALLNHLRAKLQEAASTLWRARADTWADTDQKVRTFLFVEVDPLRKQFERQLLESVGLPMKWLGLRSRSGSGAQLSAVGIDVLETPKT